MKYYFSSDDLNKTILNHNVKHISNQLWFYCDKCGEYCSELNAGYTSFFYGCRCFLYIGAVKNLDKSYTLNNYYQGLNYIKKQNLV